MNFRDLSHRFEAGRLRGGVRRPLAVTAIAGLVAAGALGLAPSASAAAVAPQPRLVGLTCDSTGSVEFTPPEGSSGADSWTSTDNYSACAGLSTDGDTAYPVSATVSGTEDGDCTGPVTDSAGNGTVTWSDGKKGTIKLSELAISRVDGTGPAAFSGTVTGGAHHVGAAVIAIYEGTDSSGCPDAGDSLTGTLIIL